MRSLAFAILLFFGLPILAFAEKIVSTGDSLTGLYANYMVTSLSAFGSYTYPLPSVGLGGSNTSYGGLNSSSYLAPTDFRTNCIQAQPDVLLFMLGINDCCWNKREQNEAIFQNYKNNVDLMFQTFSAQPFKMIVASMTPVNEARFSAKYGVLIQYTNTRIDQYNAWLAQESDAYGFTYLDINATMKKEVPDWSDTIVNMDDGLHYSATGSQWIARQFAQAVDCVTQDDVRIITPVKINHLTAHTVKVTATLTAESITADTLTIGSHSSAVPEPSALALCGMGAIGFVAFARRRFVGLFATIFLAICFMPLSAHAASVAVAGDSMAQTYYSPNLCRGWGQEISEDFNSQITFNNFSVSGSSTRSFFNGSTVVDGIPAG